MLDPGNGAVGRVGVAPDVDASGIQIPGSGATPLVNSFTNRDGLFHQRRALLRRFAAGATAVSTLAVTSPSHAAGHSPAVSDEALGVLVDLAACVGCRLCEHGCKKANGIDPGPIESYEDQSVFVTHRRPAPDSLTVVNSYRAADQPEAPVYAKVNCLHCNHAACVSACIVGALEKQENGAVTYDAWKCIGCRYCMVACPFQIPAYEFDDPWTPRVRKCEFCFERISKGELPGCVEACPRQSLLFGKRSELIALAHERIARNPGKYEDHVYGEHEVGGTSWLYLSPVPFQQAGFLAVGNAAPPALTEAIQHGVFKHWIAPVGWYSFLASMMWFTRRREKVAAADPHAAAEQELISVQRTSMSRARAAAIDATDWNNHGSSVAVAELSDPPSEHEAQDHPHHSAHAAPVRRSLNTPGVWVLLAMVLTGVGFGLYRMIAGLAATTNLDQQHPWGLWIAMDVGSGIALAGGGFVTAALVHVFHREHYHAVARSALLTALLGYTFYVPGLLADLGRWYNIWHPTLPMMWQGNSVLFEVGICVMLYLNVQYAELLPILCEPIIGNKRRFPRLSRWLSRVHDWAEKVMPAILVLGVTLSTFHQSSLGNLMVIAPYKLHELWWTPISPILFLWSAMMVGFPMVIFTILFASWALRRRPEMHVLAPLSRYVPIFLFVYLVLKVADVIVRDAYGDIVAFTPLGISWIAEMTLGVVIPLIALQRKTVRNTPRSLAITMLCVILGVVLNRLNVFVIGYEPPYAQKSYFPSIPEFAVSLGLVAALLLVYRVAVTYLPILEPAPEAER